MMMIMILLVNKFLMVVMMDTVYIMCMTGVGTKLPFSGFGGGARLCPGSKLAPTEICILHHLVTKFE